MAHFKKYSRFKDTSFPVKNPSRILLRGVNTFGCQNSAQPVLQMHTPCPTIIRMTTSCIIDAFIADDPPSSRYPDRRLARAGPQAHPVHRHKQSWHNERERIGFRNSIKWHFVAIVVVVMWLLLLLLKGTCSIEILFRLRLFKHQGNEKLLKWGQSFSILNRVFLATICDELNSTCRINKMGSLYLAFLPLYAFTYLHSIKSYKKI